jgi:excisionase family DNA binding protein
MMFNANHERERLPVLAVKINDAARIAGVGRNTIFDELDNGTLRGRKLGSAVLIEIRELERWLSALPYRESR